MLNYSHNCGMQMWYLIGGQKSIAYLPKYFKILTYAILPRHYHQKLATGY